MVLPGFLHSPASHLARPPMSLGRGDASAGDGITCPVDLPRKFCAPTVSAD